MNKNKPDLIANSVKESADGKSYFTKIGAAWKNKAGGFQLRLDALPINGEIVLLPPKDHEEVSENV